MIAKTMAVNNVYDPLFYDTCCVGLADFMIQNLRTNTLA